MEKVCRILLTALFPASFSGIQRAAFHCLESIQPFNRLITRLDCFDALKGCFCGFMGIKKRSRLKLPLLVGLVWGYLIADRTVSNNFLLPLNNLRLIVRFGLPLCHLPETSANVKVTLVCSWNMFPFQSMATYISIVCISWFSNCSEISKHRLSR